MEGAVTKAMVCVWGGVNPKNYKKHKPFSLAPL